MSTIPNKSYIATARAPGEGAFQASNWAIFSSWTDVVVSPSGSLLYSTFIRLSRAHGRATDANGDETPITETYNEQLQIQTCTQRVWLQVSPIASPWSPLCLLNKTKKNQRLHLRRRGSLQNDPGNRLRSIPTLSRLRDLSKLLLDETKTV